GRIERGDCALIFRSKGLAVDLSCYPFQEAAAEGPATLGFRPEHLVLDGAGGLPTIPGRVSVVEPMGSDAVVWFDWADQSLSLRLMGDVALQPGDAVAPGLDIAKASLFGADGARL
ncbi:TOBE domain-containing protein, partial [Rhizobium phaseoli]